jgi:bifunctional non-homologous end joining protein LigD
VLYPKQGITKRDLARFYEGIADHILPHLEDRPTTLVRCPEGVDAECFYQKHVGFWAPDTLRRVRIQEKTKVGEYLIVDSLAGLIGLVQLGILEIHTWSSRVAHLEQPDRLVFDLDPAPDTPYPRVIEAALRVRDRLEALGLTSFVKTTGGKGLHVVTPITPGPSWGECADFARAVVTELESAHPDAYTTQMSKARRGGRLFLDHLRNVRGATSVAAYSTRARPSAPVSVPLAWSELTPAITPDHFTIATLPARLDALGADPWAGYERARRRLTRAMRRAVGLSAA